VLISHTFLHFDKIAFEVLHIKKSIYSVMFCSLIIMLCYVLLLEDPMTSICKLDLDILEIYPYTKMKFLRQGLQKLDLE